MSIVEDYNYRSLNRKDLMSLSSIHENDMNIKKFKQLDTKRDWSINLYNMDIPGSSPRKYGSLVNKIDYVNKLDDIERTNPKQLHFKLNRPEFNLTNNDIDGSVPQCVKFKTLRNGFNPLEPKYKLPHYDEIEPEIPKFIRDNIKIDDIDGAHPKRYFKWKTRSNFVLDEIEGAKPRKPKVRKANYSNYDYSDVTNFKFMTKRCLDPLDPVYEVKYGNGENYIHGKIEGSKPVTYPPIIYTDPFNLKTTDISGAQIGSKNKFNRYSSMNHNLILCDIEGARSGSLKKGIITDRKINPLDPIYNLPGNLELGQNNNPYGNTLHSRLKAKTEVNTPDEEMTLNKLKMMKRNPMNNPINGKIEEIKKTRSHGAKGENVNIAGNEVVGFNNQIFQEEAQYFDPEKYKKPEPYHGFVHEKYIISSDNNIHRKFEDKKKSPLNKDNKESKLRQSKVGYHNLDNSMANSYKQSFAQKLDKFIGSV